MTKRQPPRLAVFKNRVLCLTRYRSLPNGQTIAYEKHDLTNDFAEVVDDLPLPDDVKALVFACIGVRKKGEPAPLAQLTTEATPAP